MLVVGIDPENLKLFEPNPDQAGLTVWVPTLKASDRLDA